MMYEAITRDEASALTGDPLTGYPEHVVIRHSTDDAPADVVAWSPDPAWCVQAAADLNRP